MTVRVDDKYMRFGWHITVQQGLPPMRSNDCRRWARFLMSMADHVFPPEMEASDLWGQPNRMQAADIGVTINDKIEDDSLLPRAWVPEPLPAQSGDVSLSLASLAPDLPDSDLDALVTRSIRHEEADREV